MGGGHGTGRCALRTPLSVRRRADGSLEFRWPAVPAKRYQLEVATSLEGPYLPASPEDAPSAAFYEESRDSAVTGWGRARTVVSRGAGALTMHDLARQRRRVRGTRPTDPPSS